MASAKQRILVIKLGALGDFVLAFGPFAAIRAQHPDAEITLLTTAPFAALARSSPYFDHVTVDSRPRWWDAAQLWQLAGRLRGFDFVYDLQTSGRSSRYHLLAGMPRWSGIARFASHPHANTDRDRLHTVDRQREQLRMAGIARVPPPDLSWLTDRSLPFDVPPRAVMLVPGAAPHRPAKRWPAPGFGQLAAMLQAQDMRPVVVGTAAEADLAATIRFACPEALDLTGRTGIAEVAALAARCCCAVGNDTGPMHLAAAVGCASLVLFSAESDPALTAPRGPAPDRVRVLQVPDLAELPVERVAAALPAP